MHVVLRLHKRCQRRLKKTESNKCSAVAMWMVKHKQKEKKKRKNYKQFGLKAITNHIENQPANHARSTNVHRATRAHAETMHAV